MLNQSPLSSALSIRHNPPMSWILMTPSMACILVPFSPPTSYEKFAITLGSLLLRFAQMNPILVSRCSSLAGLTRSDWHSTNKCTHSHPLLTGSEQSGHCPHVNTGSFPLLFICCQAPSMVGKALVRAMHSQRTPSARSGRFAASLKNPLVTPKLKMS